MQALHRMSTDTANNGTTNTPRFAYSAVWKRLTDLLSSAKLALTLLIVILACCVTGVTIIRDNVKAWSLIFSTLWFNGILVLLIVNVGFCFFARIWKRKVTLVSLGMILFHLSFIAMFAGIIYNSMFYFRGMIRLTEGETLPNNDLQSYDQADRGRFFDIATFRGETTLVRMHANYLIDGRNKRAAYEIEVGRGKNKKQEIIYVTKKLSHNGFQFINDREGYSLLIKLHDREGNELYGAHVPLQSLKQKNETYLFTTGTREGPGSFAYPQEPLTPMYALQTAYIPSQMEERAGDVVFQIWPIKHEPPKAGEKPIAEGKVHVGERFKIGDHYLSVGEIRYWVMMSVRYEPGKPIVLASLWVGLGGIIITFIGRMKKQKI